MKPTAVIPLMWEPWEFRPADLDLPACREKGILVLGTNEHDPPCKMDPYCGFLAMKLLFDLGLEGYQSQILLLGDQPILGGAIEAHLRAVGCRVDCFPSGQNDGIGGYEQLAEHFSHHGKDYDLILVAELTDSRCLLGEEGALSYEMIQKINPGVAIGIITGNIDQRGLRQSGLYFLPEEIQPFGYLSYQPNQLGPRMILDLYGGGLKVGEVMARARLAGKNLEETVQITLEKAPALDFSGTESWLAHGD